MGRTAWIISVFYGVLAVLSLVLVAVVWVSARRRDREPDTALLARREKSWFAVAVVLLTALLFATIFFTPYGKSAPANKQVVRVDGFQFGWSIQPTSFKANVPVQFRIHALDVSHAFAVYNSDNHLLFQVQAVPGKTQNRVYTFRRAGIYQVLCFEFCGLFHDQMRATFRVTPNA